MGLTRLQPGACCGCGAACTSTICVTDCTGAAIEGATVAVKDGSTTVASGDTGSGGCVSLDIGAAGSYTVVVSAAGYDTSTTTQSLPCGQGPTIILTATDPSGYNCQCSQICPAVGNTLILNDGIGDVTLTFGTVPIAGYGEAWWGCAMRTVSGQCSWTTAAQPNCAYPDEETYGDFEMPVLFAFFCFDETHFALATFAPVCNTYNVYLSGLDCSFWTGSVSNYSNGLAQATSVGSPSSCAPFDWEYAAPANLSDFGCSDAGECNSSEGTPPCNQFLAGYMCGVYGCAGTTFTVTSP